MKFKSSVLLQMLLIASLGLSACDSPEDKEAKYLRKGTEYLDKGDLGKARVAFKNAALAKPNDPLPRYKLGLVDEADNNIRDAFANFLYAEQQDPHFALAITKIAQYYFVGGQIEQAEKRIDGVLAEQPNNAEAHALKAAIFLNRKKFTEAHAEAAKAHEIDPSNITAVSVESGIAFAQKDFAKALDIIDKAPKNDIKSMPLYLLRLAIAEQMSDIAKVTESYQAIFKAAPNQIEYRFNLVDTLIQVGKKDDAEKFLNETIEAYPKNWDAKRKLVYFYGKEKSLDEAEALVQKLLSQYSDHKEPNIWLADIYVNQNVTDKAVKLLEKCSQGNFNDDFGINAHNFLARLNLSLGNKELAEKLADTILQKDKQNSDALFVRASINVSKSLYAAAVSDLRTIIQNNAKSKNALQLLSEVYLMQNHNDLAIDALTKAEALDPTNPVIQVRLAQVYHMNKYTDHALDMLTRVTKINPNFPIGWESLARIALDASRWDIAADAVNKLKQFESEKDVAVFLESKLMLHAGNFATSKDNLKKILTTTPNAPLGLLAATDLIRLSVDQKTLTETTHFIANIPSPSPQLLTLLGKAYFLDNNSKSAAECFDKVIQQNELIAEAYIERSNIYIKNADSKSALNLLISAQQLMPNEAKISLTLGSLYEEQKNYKAALETYEKILQINPDVDIAANNYAELVADIFYTDAQALEKAEKFVSRFTNSKNPLLLDTAGWVAARQGKWGKADMLISRALDLPEKMLAQLPKQIYYHQGYVFLNIKKEKEAKAALQKATTENENYIGLDEAKALLQKL